MASSWHSQIDWKFITLALDHYLMYQMSMKLCSTYGFPILNFTVGNNQNHFMQLEKGSFKSFKMVGGLVMLDALANPNQHDTSFENMGIRINTNCPVQNYSGTF